MHYVLLIIFLIVAFCLGMAILVIPRLYALFTLSHSESLAEQQPPALQRKKARETNREFSFGLVGTIFISSAFLMMLVLLVPLIYIFAQNTNTLRTEFVYSAIILPTIAIVGYLVVTIPEYIKRDGR